MFINSSDLASDTAVQQNDLSSELQETCYFAQLFYFNQIEKSRKSKTVMARVALNVAGFRDDYPILLSVMLTDLNWPDYHATLNFLTFAPSVHIVWGPLHLSRLKQWAAKSS